MKRSRTRTVRDAVFSLETRYCRVTGMRGGGIFLMQFSPHFVLTFSSQSVPQYSPKFDFGFEGIVLHALNSTSVFSEPKSGEFYLINIAEAVDARFLSLKVNFACQIPEAILLPCAHVPTRYRVSKENTASLTVLLMDINIDANLH